MFEDVRHERSLLLLSILTDTDISRQKKFTEQEINFIKNLFLEKLHRQKCSKEYFFLQIIK